MPCSKIQIGQLVLIPAKISKGMFPSERYFYWQVSPDKAIAGYVTEDQIEGNKIRAVVIDCFRGDAVLALPGELSQNNLVHVPLSFVREHAAT